MGKHELPTRKECIHNAVCRYDDGMCVLDCGHFESQVKEGENEAIKIIKSLLEHLPDREVNGNCDPSWDYAWDEMSSEAQSAVKLMRRIATDFLHRKEGK